MHSESSDAVIGYFRAKRRELIALADLPVCNHSGLKGGHREEIYRTYLSEVLPRRYSVGRGMVYGLFHRSHEADIVIWDSHAYPSLPLSDHAFYFAESVRNVLECKSTFSTADLKDMLVKSQAGQPHQGLMISSHHIATSGMFLKGGRNTPPVELLASCHDEVDMVWPDVMLFLEPGIVAIKFDHGPDSIGGGIAFFDYGEDALLAFTTALLKTVDDRVVHSESRFYLDRYAAPVMDREPFHVSQFRLMRFVAGHVPLWR